MKIGYSATFNYPNSLMPFEKHWVEEDELLHGLNLLDITDEQMEQLTKNIRRIQYAIKRQVIDFQHESNKHFEKEIQAKEPDTPQTTEAKIIAQIYGCSDLVVLKSFELLSSRYPTVKAAYEQQFEKLSKSS